MTTSVDELLHWPRFVGMLARHYRVATDRKNVPLKEQDAAFTQLNNAVSLLSIVGIHLPREDRVPPKAVHTEFCVRCGRSSRMAAPVIPHPPPPTRGSRSHAYAAGQR